MSAPVATPPTARPAKSGNAWLWAGLAVLLLGVVLAALSMVRMFGAVGLGDTFASPVVEAPVTLVEYYEPETYFVYQALDGAPRVGPSHVDVRGVDGELLVTFPRYQATIDDGAASMVAVAAFTVTRAGEYSVTVSPDEPTQVRVAPALGTGVGAAVAWGAAIGVGVLVSLVGLTLMVVGLVRRLSTRIPEGAHTLTATGGALPTSASTPAIPQPVQTSPPPGWYPDPLTANARRYWDGHRWTEHQA